MFPLFSNRNEMIIKERKKHESVGILPDSEIVD